MGKLDKKHRSILDKNVDLFKRYILVGAMEARWSWAKFAQLVWVEWRILDKNVDRFNDQNLDVVLLGQVEKKNTMIFCHDGIWNETKRRKRNETKRNEMETGRNETKRNEIYWKSIKLCENQRNSVNITENQRTSVKIYENQRN